ncbi:MAG: hypothetical protein AAF810_01990, partial [Cyanobacteria bacterium P01_D01_bin.36]
MRRTYQALEEALNRISKLWVKKGLWGILFAVALSIALLFQSCGGAVPTGSSADGASTGASAQQEATSSSNNNT